jgi:branched-chain amino acid transport system substrate-binding protein
VKKVLFLLFTCLVLVAMVIPACKPSEGGLNIPPGAKTIKVGVIGPMQFMQGQQNWLGATMAAEDINKAGGVKVGDETYYIDLIKSDSNETLSVTDAASAMEKLISVDKADFIMGGFRTEAVIPMQEVAMDNKKIFLGCGSATAIFCTNVKNDYNRYKYWFRVTPFVSAYLVDNTLMEIAMAGAIIKEETGIQRKLRVAICAEGAQWADSMVGMMNNWVPKKLGMEVSGTWRPSPNATELTAEMTAMQTANTDIICPIISGAVGIPYGRSWGELKVPAASVGINVESQSSGYMKATNNFGNYDTGLASYSKNMEPTPQTHPFFEEFVARSGEVPAYNAGTYDAMYILTAALTRAGTLDSDAVVVELEKTDTTAGTVSPRFTFTGMDAKLGNPHDVNYGPGANTGIANQWQDGELLGVWPNADYADASVAAGYDPGWATVDYPGTAKWKVPPVLLEKLKAEAATEPAAPPPAEEPAAPPAEEPAAPPAEEPAAPPAAGETSYPALTYTNDQYGFSIQYPNDWVARPELMVTPNYLASFGVSAFVPGINSVVFDATEPESKEWIVKSFKALQSTMPKVLSDIKEETLADGTKAYTYKASYVSGTGYDIFAYCLDADRGDKRIRVYVFTIDAMEPYNEPLFSEIAHTLTFK